MFSWLKKKREPRCTEDPVFGRLTFVSAKDSSLSYWQGMGRFSPVAADIFFEISANQESGPGESQRQVYRRIVERYEEILVAVTPLLRREYGTAQAVDDSLPRDVVFCLETLAVPEKESESMKWAMHFACSDGGDWLFTVHMLGWQPTGKISVMD